MAGCRIDGQVVPTAVTGQLVGIEKVIADPALATVTNARMTTVPLSATENRFFVFIVPPS
jgi:hypothetical protein